jgi:Ca2+-transporting ATPase
MSVVIRMPNGKIRNYVKGAAEWVVKKCTQVLQPDGSLKPLDGALMEETMAHIFDMANRGLRCITVFTVHLPHLCLVP